MSVAIGFLCPFSMRYSRLLAISSSHTFTDPRRREKTGPHPPHQGSVTFMLVNTQAGQRTKLKVKTPGIISAPGV